MKVKQTLIGLLTAAIVLQMVVFSSVLNFPTMDTAPIGPIEIQLHGAAFDGAGLLVLGLLGIASLLALFSAPMMLLVMGVSTILVGGLFQGLMTDLQAASWAGLGMVWIAASALSLIWRHFGFFRKQRTPDTAPPVREPVSDLL